MPNNPSQPGSAASAALFPWTPEQRTAIESTGGSVLVSAAAGSGKTAVLAERCAHLVAGAQPPCDVMELLVVTFTKSAAAEMRSRIQSALQKRFAANPSPRLQRQLALVEHAHVSTLHAFCADLLRRNFHRARIDPDFQTLDENESLLLQSEVAEDLLERKHERDETGEFRNLIDAYADGHDDRLMERVKSASQLLGSLRNRDGWIRNTLDEIREASANPQEKSLLGRRLIEEIKTVLARLERQATENAAAIRKMDRRLVGYADQLDQFRNFLKQFGDVLAAHGLDALVSEIRDWRATIPVAPRVAATVPGKDLAKAMFDGVRDAMKAESLEELTRFDSQMWRDGMGMILPHAQAFLDLVSEFDAEYARAKNRDRTLDFSDLERRTLAILCENPDDDAPAIPTDLARSQHEQFRHVLVDEYQDINEIQDAILTLLSRECLGDRDRRPANLFCVGDAKQSIFRFRLADPRRILQRQKYLSESPERGRVIHLRDNFRSRAKLLEAINSVFQRLMTRQTAEIDYDDTQRLTPGAKFPADSGPAIFAGAPIEMHLLPHEVEDSDDSDAELERAEYEAMLVADRIEEMLGKAGSPPRLVQRNGSMQPIEFSDIVVLLRAMHFKADFFADVLRKRGIPVHSENGAGFFHATEVRDVLCLLQILDNQQQDIPLAAVLRSPLAGLPEPDDALAAIRVAFPGDEEHPIPFHEAVRRYALEQDDALAARLRDFLIQLSDWRDLANKRPVAELLWRLYERTGYLAYCCGLPDGRQRVANLVYLHERAGQFGTFRRQGLRRFLQFLEGLRAERDINRPTIAADAGNVVRVMSIHRAKGLEFPVVFIPDLGKVHNFGDEKGAILVDREAGLGMDVVDRSRLIRYPSLASTLVAMTLHRQTLAEELRLLYVAMTRAKEHLILIGTCKSAQIELWKSTFANHRQALPAETVLDSRTFLDLLGPVWIATGGDKSSVLNVTQHSADEMQKWKSASPKAAAPAWTESQQRMAELKPLDPAPPPNEIARRITERFEIPYPHKADTQRAAAKSVTELAKHPVADEFQLQEFGGEPPAKPQRKLDFPRFFAAVSTPHPTDIGTATHLVLQHWDFSLPQTNEADIGRQIHALIDRRIIPAAQADWVDRTAIEWFLKSDLGGELCKSHSQLQRELPFALAWNDSRERAQSGLDSVMIRGRIDLLYPIAGGVAIVDYKTDDVSGPALQSRTEMYRGQMRFYRQAIESVAGKKVAGIHLVFLKARQIVSRE
jgi:ATP-dependent helicase/nuclease subunit A